MMTRIHLGAFALGLGVVAASAGATVASLPEIPYGSTRVFSFELVASSSGSTQGRERGHGRTISVSWHAKEVNVRFEKCETGWSILDGSAAADHQASIATRASGVYDVYARVLGMEDERALGGAEPQTDRLTGETLVLVGTIDLKSGHGQHGLRLVPASIFDARLQEVTWTMDRSADRRLAQFRIYARG